MLRTWLLCLLAFAAVAWGQAIPASAPKELTEAYQAGLKAVDDKQYEAAIALFNRAVTIDPKQKAIWARLGSVTLEFAKTKPAIVEHQWVALQAADAFSHAVALAPQDANIRTFYGIALGEAGKLAQAREAFAAAAQLDPANASVALLDEAVYLHRAGMDREAYQTLDKVPDSSPQIETARRQQSVAAIGIYLQSAGGKFQDLRGKQTSPSEAFWESTLGMRGGKCSIGEFPDTAPATSLQCDFDQFATLQEARPSYEKLIQIVREGLGPLAPNWTSQAESKPDGTAIRYTFSEPSKTVTVQIDRRESPDKKVYFQLYLAVRPL